MRRRTFVGALMAMAATPALDVRANAPDRQAVFLVPGYRPPAGGNRAAVPSTYKGWRTLVTRLEEGTGREVRAVFPVRGHGVVVRPGGGHAFFCSQEGRSIVTFDPDTLAPGSFIEIPRPYEGGGHAVYTADGAALVTVERRRTGPFKGRPEDHYGRVVVRDAATLRPLAEYSCHGIRPHEVSWLPDGRHVAIANYGSTLAPGRRGVGTPYTVEPCLTVLEAASGKLVHKQVFRETLYEMRHIAVRDQETVYAITNRQIYEGRRKRYGIAPVLSIDLSAGHLSLVARSDGRGPAFLGRAQSVIHDPIGDQVIVTLSDTHRIAVIDGADGRVARFIDTKAFGVEKPRGVALHPDGAHYVVTGSWQGLAVLRRSDHQLVRTLPTTFYDHSHLTAV